MKFTTNIVWGFSGILIDIVVAVAQWICITLWNHISILHSNLHLSTIAVNG